LHPVPFALALLLTFLNALKPVVIDDACYLSFAREFAAHPDAPYAFRFHWFQYERDAFTILAPPVLPYYLAGAILLFGDSPLICKLALFPIVWLFTASLFALCDRIARRRRIPLIVLTALSPLFLTSLNLMLDVPAMAFGLAAVALFLRAVDRGSILTAAAAGVMAALAAETKYTGMTAVPTMFLAGAIYAWRLRSWKPLALALAASTIAAVLFVACELAIAASDPLGRSHFLFHIGLQSPPDVSWKKKLKAKLELTWGFFGNLGGLSPGIVLLALAGLGTPRWTQSAAAGFFVAGYLALALVPESLQVLGRNADGTPSLEFSAIVFGAFAVVSVAAFVAVVCRLTFARQRVRFDPADVFLIMWLLGELLAYFVLSPFAAVRRLMGFLTVLTLVIGRLLAKAPRTERTRAMIDFAVWFGVLLGAFYWVVEDRESRVEPRAVERARMVIGERGGTVWYVGHWGFQYYADRLGWKALDPERSLLKAGDWLVAPEPKYGRPDRQDIEMEADFLGDPIEEWIETATLPVQTLPFNYCGPIPMIHSERPRAGFRVYTIRKDWTPRTSEWMKIRAEQDWRVRANMRR
jgi:4-amino-4-deoxy-L-arabinose transferase-like glycosyltransferase